MSIAKLEAKLERINRAMYKEASKSNFDKAEALQKQYVDLSCKIYNLCHLKEVI